MSVAVSVADLPEPAANSSSIAPMAGRRSRSLSVFRSKKIIAGLVIVAFFVFLAIFGQSLAPYDPSAIGPDVLQAPSSAHWLGTTESGQDVLSQVLVGARISMLIGFIAAVAATALSVLVGVTAGFVGGLGDDLLSGLANVFLVIPALPLVIVLAGYLPSKGSLSVAIVIALTGWAWGARVLRAQTLSIRRRDYVQASRAIGERTSRIIAVEVLPNNVAIIATGFLFTFIFAIVTQSSLAFLGLSSVSEWSWGTILYWAQSFAALNLGAWWWFVPPGLCIALVGMGLTLINFGIDEYINPRLRAVPSKKTLSDDAASARATGTRVPPSVTMVAAAGEQARTPLLEVHGLSVRYGYGPDAVQAVSDVDINLYRGELLGLAGESGSGKSTIAYAMTKLLRLPGHITTGSVFYHPSDGAVVDVVGMNDDEMRSLRWDTVAMVFQSAMNALNPVLSVETQLTDVLKAHRPEMSGPERQERAAAMLRRVGLSPDRMASYPHELSGGMRQRVMIAMALLLDPDVIVMDEPTTALDVVMQRGILQEIDRLRSELGFAVIFITHDLSLLTEIANRIAIMYAGRIVELGTVRDLYLDPLHPYSQGLLQSFPPLRAPRRALKGIPGTPPDLRAVPSGCAFHPRCPHAMPICSESLPDLLPASGASGPDGERLVACWLYQQAGDQPALQPTTTEPATAGPPTTGSPTTGSAVGP